MQTKIMTITSHHKMSQAYFLHLFTKNLYVSRDSEVPSWVRMLLCCHPSHHRLRHRAGNLHSVHVQHPPT